MLLSWFSIRWRAPNVRATSRTQKIVKNRICGMTHMARSARGSARAPKKLSDSKTPIQANAFWLLDRFHISKTHEDSECWSLRKKEKSKFSNLNFKIWSWDSKILIFPFYANFNIRYLCEFWRCENDSIIKRHLFVLKFSSLIIFWRARTSARAARHGKYSKDAIFGDFSEYGSLRANWTRAEVRARKFGARYRIENQK